jgi:hypothetical protein
MNHRSTTIGQKRKRLMTSTMIASLAAIGVPAALAVTAIVTPTVATAQDYTSGTLVGTVTDEAGAPVSGAAVIVKSQGTGIERSATTNAAGEFRVPLIPLGAYNVAISKEGYNPTSDSNIQVRLGGSSAYGFTMATAGSVAEVVVTATANPQLDFAGTTTGTVVDVENLQKQVPIARNITALTLLAPSAIPADTAFAIGSAQLLAPASISGASAGENAFYINGLNTTNFINGLGGGTVPFDMYKNVEVKTGGYQAEFGRAIGGVINAVTKSGTNDFMFAVHGNWAPDALREDSPDTYLQSFTQSESEEKSLVFEMGGPIIKDRLFAYGLAQFQEITGQTATNGTTTSGSLNQDKRGDPFYGFKLDGYITSTQHLEFTYFDTSAKRKRTVYSFNPLTDTRGARTASQTLYQGGESYVGRYTGSFTDWLTISAAYGRSEIDQASVGNLFGVPLVQRSGSTTNIGAQTVAGTTFPFIGEREFYRGDVDLYFDLMGKHHVRAGYDRENTVLTETTVRNGGANYIYATATASTALRLPVGQDYIQRRVFTTGGGFEGVNEAMYIQDSWEIGDRLSVQMGVRQDKFSVASPLGVTAIEFDNEIAPRFGFTYDVQGDGRSKVFGSYGRYYLPIASNTSFRVFAPAIDFTEFFLPAGGAQKFGALDPVTGLPTAGLGPQVVGAPTLIACASTLTGKVAATGTVACNVRNNGTALDPATYVARNLESTAEDEFILGYSHRMDNDWTFGASLTYRNLLRVSEDALLDQGVLAYCARKNIAGCRDLGYGDQVFYNIINPGGDARVVLPYALPNGEEIIDLTAGDIGLPKVRREYIGLELTFERPWDGKWNLQGSYVLSENKGNFEGALKSDTGQTDVGIVSDFDFLSFVPGQYGELPNHRAHQFKAFGAYAVTENFLVGSNMSILSPRKYGCIGLAPNDLFNGEGAVANSSYGVENARFCGGKIVNRGSAFESDWVTRFDMSFRYTVPTTFSRYGELVLRADVFNVFNLKAVIENNEFGETDGGSPDPNYKAPVAYQAPRSFRFGFDWQF